ncbi:MAG: LysM peptidoglycan-binding domain-containing protein [Deltaproteobacteria bacterium]|nr:LysM peptidoglycan-binding domain-containing protein [Deltaproteobacteria bacterium]
MRYGPLALAVLLFTSLFASSDAHADRTYVVRNGDTLSGIARRFHVTISTLRRANRLRSSDSIRAGARLTIPGRQASNRAARRAGYHVVRRGDTLSGIAARYRVPIRALKRANRIRGENIRIGARLRIPGRRSENHLPRVAERELRPDQEEAKARAERLGLGSVRVAHTLLGGPGPEDRWVAAARQAPSRIPAYAFGVGTPIVPREDDEEEDAEETPDEVALEDDGHEGVEETPPETSSANDTPEPVAGPGTLRSPLDEAVYLRGWGSGAGGYHLAVDLYAPPGTPVKASARGIVAYEGHGLRGYGRMVVILHPSGRVTAYAHNRETLVVEGELVARGQIIALVGNTGISRGPHVHFMLVDGGEHCDAMPLFRPRIRWRNGNIVETNPVAWTGERPEEVRCLPKSSRPHPGTRRRRRRR